MVLVQPDRQSRSSVLPFGIQPNPTRIAGMAGAIALNVAVLMALLVPMDLPTPQFAKPRTVIVPIDHWVEPPPKPPTVVPVTPPRPQRPQPVVQPRTVVPPVENPPVVTTDARSIDLPYLPPVETAPGPALPDVPPGPAVGMRLEYAVAPPPTYPREELLAGREGTVVLQVLVDVDGSPLDVDIHTSSGNRRLDREARQHVLRQWKFRPAMRGGQPVQAIGLVPIDFRLQ